MKEIFKREDTDQILKALEFSVGGSTFNSNISVGEVINHQLYKNQTLVPQENGPLDYKFGPNTSNKDILCYTCHKDSKGCPGHFGHLCLTNYLYQIGYFDNTVFILQMICKNCSRVLIPPDKRKIISKQLDQGDFTKNQLKNEAKMCKICPYCKAVNGKVKKGGFLKISHEFIELRNEKKFLYPQIKDFYNKAKKSFLNDNNYENSLNHFVEDVLPEKAYQLFKQIKKEDLKFILYDKEGRPEDIIVKVVIVPPNTIRPSAPSMTGTGTTEDDITVKLSELAKIKLFLDEKKRNKSQAGLYQDINYKSNAVHATLINGQPTSMPFNVRPKKPSRGVIQRLKGKQGRFRQNLSGKRVNYSGRTVISPDPYLGIDEVGIPVYLAKILTYPERVTDKNKKLLIALIKNGANKWPGANKVIIMDKEKTVFDLKYANYDFVISKLKQGDIVERHMINKDIVLFNRQPSLHRISIMSHFAKIGYHRTFRFNECVCNPYNADFDGDEMNIHLPQTEEARAEANILMGTKSNICTPKDGAPIISAIQDFITAGYLMTSKDVFLNKTQVARLVSAMNQDSYIDLPRPAFYKPEVLWTGKQIFSLILKPRFHSKVKIFLETQSKTIYKNKSKLVKPEFCPDDGYVIIYNSELLSGRMDKVTLGAGSKNSVFYTLLIDYGQQSAADAMKRLARLSTEFLSDRGFSIGVGDVTPNHYVLNEKMKKLNEGYKTCEVYIKKFKDGCLQALPGCTKEETLELKLLGELSKIRNDAGDSCKKLMHVTCAPKNMAQCGSKGSFVNLSQMAALVGQQAISGKRVPLCFDSRPLHFFEEKSKAPEAGGFVENSFYSGLNPNEYFFHTQAGREGLVDTAVKTADTGYMQRRLVKCLEDLSAEYDGTVRSATNQIVQFLYGGDGLDPLFMEGKSKPVNLERVLKVTKVNNPCQNKNGLSSFEIKSLSDSLIKSQCKNEKNSNLYSELKNFIENEILKKVVEYEKKGDIKNLSRFDSRKITSIQLTTFISKVCAKLKKSVVEPGTAVGAICAQSVGEPGTQMTLKTFHFAGVASMNITQGVPRIKEIINGSEKIATPIIEAELENCFDNIKASIIQQKLEKTKLKQVIHSVSYRLFRKLAVIFVQLDTNIMQSLRIQLNAFSIKESIEKDIKLKKLIANAQLEVKAPNVISILIKGAADKVSFDQVFKGLHYNLGEVQVSGLTNINRAVVDKKQKKDNKKDIRDEYKLVVEGTDLMGVMTTRGVKATKTISNSTLEVRGYFITIH